MGIEHVSSPDKKSPSDSKAPGWAKTMDSSRQRYVASALIWLMLPSLTLLPFRSSPWEALFRAQPYNDSYDAMFVAAMAGTGATSLWAYVSCRRYARFRNDRLLIQLSWPNAFLFFELFLSATLAVLNFMNGAHGSSVIWSVAFIFLLITTPQLQNLQTKRPETVKHRKSLSEFLASIGLVALAALFIAFPVLQAWSGPPEPFVRWHPFGEATELIWRGVFLSFAIGMLISAFDPGGRNRLFMITLFLSGYLHSAEMAIDNLHSASLKSMNANPEHLYGDILGWFSIASFSALFLTVSGASLRSSSGESESGEQLRVF